MGLQSHKMSSFRGRVSQELWFRRWHRTRDINIRNSLIESALPLAYSVAKRYQHSQTPFEDLVQVARLGLVKAVEGFDPNRNVAFSSYAVPIMVGEIKRYFRDTAWAVHLPRSLQEHALLVTRTERVLSSRLGRSPSTKEIMKFTGLSAYEVNEAQRAGSAQHAHSIDSNQRVSEGDSPSYLETIGFEDEKLQLVEDRQAIMSAVKHLPDRERKILYLRFGHGKTQSQIANEVGLSQMQISRLLTQSIDRLRRATSFSMENYVSNRTC